MPARAVFLRATAFLALWIVLAGTAPADLAFGALAACLAAWASVRLLPPSGRSVRTGALLAFCLRFLGQSARGGWDVARRALDPRLPLAPGMVHHASKLRPGPARGAFVALSSLLPGTVPVEDEGALIRYHALDAGPPVAHALAEDEAHFARMLADGEAK